MDRLKPLNIWETNEEGGPILKSSEDAIRFAMSAFESIEVYDVLLKQRTILTWHYKHTKKVISNLKNMLTKMAFDMQFTNDAIREIVRLLMQQTTLGDVDDLWIKLCPFCERPLIDHADNGDCPK